MLTNGGSQNNIRSDANASRHKKPVARCEWFLLELRMEEQDGDEGRKRRECTYGSKER